MTKFEFVQEQDNIRNKVFYFTRKDGVFVMGTMTTDKDKAYDTFLNLSSQKLPTEETILFTVLTP
jgi:hypothetical protein